MGEVFGGAYHGRKDADSVAELAAFLRARIAVDRIIIVQLQRTLLLNSARRVGRPLDQCCDVLSRRELPPLPCDVVFFSFALNIITPSL